MPPYKVLRRSDDSPVSRHGDSTGHGKAKATHNVRGKNGERGGGDFAFTLYLILLQLYLFFKIKKIQNK